MSCWKICIEQPFMNCDKIYPIQQKKVAQILNHVKNNDNVKKVIIFGSSTTSNCHIGSDVDIYMELEKDVYPLHTLFLFSFDLWTNFSVDSRLLAEIKKKGVLVYERNITS